MNHHPQISIVVPCHNEEKNIPEMERRIEKVMEELGMNYELIFINDGSRDHTLTVALGLAQRKPSIIVVDFARNFGHQQAVTAGIEHAMGDAVVLIDADLQDPPEVIKDLVAEWRKGFDVVYAQRSRREGETWFKRVTASLFYRFLRRCTSTNIPADTGDFRLMDRKVVEALKRMPEKHRFIRGMVSWVGFRQAGVTYERKQRFAGKTNYPFFKMFLFAIDAVTSFSVMPLRVVTFMGVAILSITFFYTLYILFMKLFVLGGVAPGLAALNILVAFLGGIQMVCLGVVGEYIGRIYEESKGRPLYLIREIYRFPFQQDFSRTKSEHKKMDV